MCSTELLLSKNEKGLTLLLTFFWGYSIFCRTPLIVKGCYLLRMSNDYCFRICRNVIEEILFESSGKISQRPKRNKRICLWVRNLKYLQGRKNQEKICAGVFFKIKLRPLGLQRF